MQHLGFHIPYLQASKQKNLCSFFYLRVWAWFTFPSVHAQMWYDQTLCHMIDLTLFHRTTIVEEMLHQGNGSEYCFWKNICEIMLFLFTILQSLFCYMTVLQFYYAILLSLESTYINWWQIFALWEESVNSLKEHSHPPLNLKTTNLPIWFFYQIFELAELCEILKLLWHRLDHTWQDWP